MQTIADQLFVGNKLASGELHSSSRLRIDLRNIKSPLIVFCSWGDDITPPQQALELDWILDLYGHEDEIVKAGQTIVYCLHESIGHLGIFVSNKVATKEHDQFALCMDMIDLMPPGLYEAAITGLDESVENPELVQGGYLFSLETRKLDDIRKLGGNSPEDDLAFATAARVSKITKGVYSTVVRPAVRAMVTETSAEPMRRSHPNRLRFEMFAENPCMRPVAEWAETVRGSRRPASPDNPFLSFERMTSDMIASGLEMWGNARDAATEAFFFNTYGSPLLQAMVGLRADETSVSRRIARDMAREAAAAQAAAHLEQRIDQGGLIEAVARTLIYVRLPEGKFDERGLAAWKPAISPRLRRPSAASTELSLRPASARMLRRCAVPSAVHALGSAWTWTKGPTGNIRSA